MGVKRRILRNRSRETWWVGHDIRWTAARKGGRAHNEGLAKIESMLMAEEVRGPQTLGNEDGPPLVKWVVLNKLVPGSMEFVVGTSIVEEGEGLYEQVTEDEGEGEGESKVRSQKIEKIIRLMKEVVRWSKWTSK